jgi:D-alanine transaminase/branched-chain amino acid aminotransferase
MPEAKTIDYLQAICLQPFIKENNADDVLYYDQTEIRECPRANFFIVTKNDAVLTPSKNVLKGITRKKILDFAELNVKETGIDLHDLENAKEAFITSTSKNVLPVLKIDGNTVGNGMPGEITAKIYNRLLAAKGIIK